MATTITAGNTTNNGAAVSSDNTGTLNILTGPGAGTTAISIDASQNVAITGALTIAGQPAGGNYILRQYTANDTWNATTAKAAGLKAIKVTVVGAGGAGGLGVSTPVSQLAGGGGGSGASAVYYAPALSIPGPQAITAGSGTNSFGAIVSSTAGSVGTNATPSAAGTGGAGGSATGGTLNINGGSGNPGVNLPGTNVSGSGSGSLLGIGGGAKNTPGAGVSASGFGSGGGGAVGAPFAGGTGAPGIVIIEEFY